MDTEHHGMKVFLVSASSKDMDQLYMQPCSTASWSWAARWSRNRRPEHLHPSLVQPHPVRMTVMITMSWLH